MRILGGVLQIIFFLVLIGASLLIAGLIANRLPLSDPPGFFTRLSTYLTTHVAETTKDSPFPELRPRRYEAPPELLFDVARRAAQSLGWEIITLDADTKEIRAVATTQVWGFKDDVTIQTPPAEPSGSWLLVRSESRVGRGDLGANTRHILNLQQAVNTLAPVQAVVPQQQSDIQAGDQGTKAAGQGPEGEGTN